MSSRGSVFQIFFFLFLIFEIGGMISCSEEGEEERKKEWINNEVLVKIAEYKAEKNAACIAEILVLAEAEVDSILSQKDLFENIMNQDIPDKPIKPDYIPLDSAALDNHKVEKVLK